MPGDELHEEAAGTESSAPGARRERTGPRHAAPKKPFLTRLHVPAGKAVAMAAMPSAVLLSMGVTPQLAYAKPLPKNPFGDGPCVSQQDRADEEAQKEAEAAAKAEEERKLAEAERKAAEEAEEKAQQEKEEQDSGEENSSGSGSDSNSDSGPDDASDGGTTGSGGGSGGSPEPEPSPSGEDGSGGLLGGVGDALGDILGGGDQNTEPEAAPEPSDSPEASSKESSDPVGDTVDKVGEGVEGVEDTVGEVGDGLEDATGDLPVPDASGEDEASSDEAADEAEAPVDENGDKAFPCVEEKKVAGEPGQTPAVLPNEPWTLKASSLSIRGQDYEGVFNVRTANGETKQVLKFTADTVDIGDLHQITQGPDGTEFHVRAAAGSTSTIRDGQVTLYTERLEGKLFGLIPIVFDPEHPPPLNIPNVYFTDVTVTQAGQFGGTLTVPGLHSTIKAG